MQNMADIRPMASPRFSIWQRVKFQASSKMKRLANWLAILEFTIFFVLADRSSYSTLETDDSNFSWDNINDLHSIINDASSHGNKIFDDHTTKKQHSDGIVKKFVSYFTPSYSAKLHEPQRNFTKYDKHLKPHVRVKRAKRRNLIVKCCGKASCSEGSFANLERRTQEKKKKQEEVEFVDELQYKKKKKKRRKGTADISNMHAYGVFTDSGIHISCAGCPTGWPEMLTVYPEYEIGIPVTCTNCPNNWPGALNLLGIGGDPSWEAQPSSVEGGRNRNRGRGNTFYAFDTDSNFGSRPGAGGLPPDFGSNFGGNPSSDNGNEDEDQDETPKPKKRPKKKKTTAAPSEDGEDDEEDSDKKSTENAGEQNSPTVPDEKDEDEQKDSSTAANTKSDEAATTSKSNEKADNTSKAPAADNSTKPTEGGSTKAAADGSTKAAEDGSKTTAKDEEEDDDDANEESGASTTKTGDSDKTTKKEETTAKTEKGASPAAAETTKASATTKAAAAAAAAPSGDAGDGLE